MMQLIKLARRGVSDIWDEHFKTVLLLLLETLGDNDGHIRALSLRVLKEILRHQADRFKDYAELTILKVLEAHKDPVKEVRHIIYTGLHIHLSLYIVKKYAIIIRYISQH